MAEVAPVQLRAQLPDEPERRSIPFLISKLIDQEGGFRNVTEESLEAQIRDGTTDASPIDGEGGSSDEELEEEKSRPEQLQTAKGEIVQFAMDAYNESAHVLDMISLVLSKTLPLQAETTLSPFIKTALPLGSLGVEPVQAPPVTESQTQDDRAVSFGWKLQSLNNAADSLLKSATRLEGEMRKEAEYWQQALSIKEKGWSVCRLPHERHTLGVRYGFLESASEFRDQGMAALRLSPNNGVELDLGAAEDSTTRRLRVRVLEKGRTIAVSKTDPLQPAKEQTMEATLLAARNGLFDAELFHEIYKEGRGLANRGVQCLSEGISLPLEEDKKILVELPDSDDAAAEVQVDEPSEAYDKLPQLLVVALRILLCHAHRLRYNHRTRTPPPLSARKEPPFTTPVLLHVLSHLQHRSFMRSYRTLLDRLKQIFASAGLDLGVEASADDHGMAALSEPSNPQRTPLVEALVSTLCKTLESRTKIKGPSGAITLNITVRTHSMGTEFAFAMDIDSTCPELEGCRGKETFASLAKMERFLCHFLGIDLLLAAGKANQLWLTDNLHLGELCTEETMQGDYYILVVAVSRDELMLTWTAKLRNGPLEERLVWRPGENEGGSEERFVDVVESVNSRTVLVGPTP